MHLFVLSELKVFIEGAPLKSNTTTESKIKLKHFISTNIKFYLKHYFQKKMVRCAAHKKRKKEPETERGTKRKQEIHVTVKKVYTDDVCHSDVGSV